jgi:DNA-binding NtrC family response regulator
MADKILIVDDEPAIRFAVGDFLSSKGFDVREADTAASAVETFRTFRPDVTVLDFELPDGDALALLPRLKALDESASVVILTAHGSIDIAVESIKRGAEQFLTKPLQLETLAVVLERIGSHRRSRRKEIAGNSRRREELDPFIGSSAAIRKLWDEVERVLRSDSPILLHGETGSGKGVLARWLHEHSPRKEEPFVDLNCAGLSRELLDTELFGHEKGAFTGATAAKEGLLEVADRGTVFLDEIGDVDPQVQPKLLKVLEEKTFRRLGETRDRRVDVRLIAASHHDLAQLVREKKFRSDLYYRISAIPLRVPPLRERREDIPVIARELLNRLNVPDVDSAVTPEVVAVLQAHSWPGNVRELRNVLEHACLMRRGSVLTPDDLRLRPTDAAASAEGDEDLTLEELERRHIERTLRRMRGRVDEAARILGIPRSTLYQKIKRFGLASSRSQTEV